MLLINKLALIAISRLLAALLQAVSLIIVARVAGPASFGLLSVFIGLVIVFQAVFDLGITAYVTRLRATTPQSPLIAQALKIYQRVGLLLGATLVAVSIAVALSGGQVWWLMAALGLAGAIERQADVRLALAIADGDVWKNSFALVLRRALAALLVLVCIQLAIDAVFAYGLSSLIASLVSLWLSRRLVTLQRPIGNVGFVELRTVYSTSKSFWANSIGVQLRNLDIIIVAAFVPAASAGYYSAIARSLNPLMLLSSSLSTILLPMAAGSGGRWTKSLAIPVAVVTLGMSAVFVSISIYADKFVLLVFGVEFAPAIPGFRIVLIGLVFASYSSIQTSFLQARGIEKGVGRISILASIMALLGIGIGVSAAGVTGAALGLASSHVLQCLALIVLGVWNKPTGQTLTADAVEKV